ncbi:MAG: HpaII family restriction endonuclease [Alistipes sp.]
MSSSETDNIAAFLAQVFAYCIQKGKAYQLLYPLVVCLRKQIVLNHKNSKQNGRVVLRTTNNISLLCVPSELFLQEAESFLAIENLQTDVYKIKAHTTESINRLFSYNTNLSGKYNTDVIITIFVHRNNTFFKSKLGSASTLLNASRATNFVFRINGLLSEDKIGEINAINSQQERMIALREAGCKLEFVNVESEVFASNLMLVDTAMPTIMANCLLAFFAYDCKSVKSATKYMAGTNPLGLRTGDLDTFYEHKMKTLLVDVALGMKPTTMWSGRYEANGGYLVVKEDGDVICYHFYLRNELESYLFNNTKFEQASRKRHGYGDIILSDDNKLYMKLNLQIRFD